MRGVLPVPVSLLAVCVCLWLAEVSATRPGQAAAGDKAAANIFTNCGGRINTTLGYIHTPNFPHRFPSPIICRWLFHAPPGKKFVLYLTQFYLHNSFRVAEFTYYNEEPSGRATWRGRYDIGEINFEEAYLASTKPYLLIDFRVTDINNIHLRVDEYLLDVYGFNITYEMVDEEVPVRTDACTVIKCSFLGHCLASAQLDTYKCHCFPSYYGDECQYGPSCDPDKGINMCLNGGKCRYFLGSSVNTCQCPLGFHGAQCESKIDFTNPECEALGCQQRCVESDADAGDVTSLGVYDDQSGGGGKEYVCACNEGYRLAKDNKTCEEQGRLRYLIEVRMLPPGGEASEDAWSPCSHFDEIFSDQIIQQLSANLSGFWNFSIENKRREGKDFYVQFAFFGEKSEQETVWIKVRLMQAHLNVCGCRADGEYLEENIQPALHSLSLRQYDADHAIAGQFLTLACKAKGSRNTHFTWYKDGHEIRFEQSTRDIWETRIPSSDGETHLSVLSIEKALPIDDGEFSCEVSDWNQVERKSISLYIVPIPEIDLSPLHVTLREGEKGAMTCMSRDDEHANFTYSWLYNGRPLTTGPNGEHVEKLAPIGSRLTLKRVTQAATYTCVVRSLAGSASKTTQVSLLAANGLFCESEGDADEGVRWNLTPANQSDIVRCPRETQGTAYRFCKCSATQCRWQEPTFSNCSTIELDQLNNELSQVTGGYQTPNVFALLRKMSIYMLNEDPDRPYYVGNLLVQVHMLRQMFTYSQTFLANDPTNAVDFLQVVDVAGLILERAFSNNLMIGEVVANIMALTGEMQTLSKQPRFSEGAQRYNTSSLVMIVRPTCYTLASDAVTAIEPNQEHRFADHFFACSVQFLMVYQYIHSLFYNQSIFEEYEINSLVTYVSVATVGAPATVIIPHLRQLPEKSTQSNLTRCSSLGVSDVGELVWRHRGCDVLAVHAVYTVCRCKWSGHYALLQSSAQPPVLHTHVVSITPAEAIVLCYLALGTFVVLLAAQLMYKRNNHPVETAVDVNICAAMLLVCVVLVSLWGRADNMVLCVVSKAGLCCGFLVALTTLVFEMLHQLQPSHRTHTTAWIMLITMTTWGISVVVCLATVLPAHFVHPSARLYNLCGITVDHWSFYILLTVIITELMTLCALIVLVVVGVRARRQRMSNCAMIILESEQEQRNLSCLVGKSLVTTFWLLLAFAAVIVATMSSTLFSQLLVALSLMFLGLCRICFAWLPDVKKKVSLKGRSCSFTAPKKPIVKTTEDFAKKEYSKKDFSLRSADSKASSKPATAAAEPTNVDQPACHTEQEGASSSKVVRVASESASAANRAAYYNHNDETSEALIRDSQRYTKEKFEQLSALLGSSLKSAEQGSVEPVFSLSSGLHSRSRDAAYYSQAAQQVERAADTLRVSNYSMTGAGSGVSAKPDLVPDYSVYPLVKPARGVSYIRVPSTDGGHSSHDIQKQCFAANYPEG